MMQKHIEMYEKGAITADHLAVQCLHMLDPRRPELVLGEVPDDILRAILKYAQDYEPGRMRTNYGSQPAMEQVAAAKRWIETPIRK